MALLKAQIAEQEKQMAQVEAWWDTVWNNVKSWFWDWNLIIWLDKPESLLWDAVKTNMRELESFITIVSCLKMFVRFCSSDQTASIIIKLCISNNI